MHLSAFVVLFVLGLAISLSSGLPYNPDLDFIDDQNANQFLDEDSHANAKRMLYTGHEQRREVKENYEEKCERKLISAARNKPRWCPELSTWPEWVKVSAKDPVKAKKQKREFFDTE